MTRYLSLYNEERIHQALQYQTPAAVFAAGQRENKPISPTEN